MKMLREELNVYVPEQVHTLAKSDAVGQSERHENGVVFTPHITSEETVAGRRGEGVAARRANRELSLGFLPSISPYIV